MYCLCKALANGHPLSALVGVDGAARDGASQITASGTYWLSGAPMAASIATLDILEADNSAAMKHIQKMGSTLATGLLEQSKFYGVPVTISGPEAMPLMTFDSDQQQAIERPRGHLWCGEAAKGGEFVPPSCSVGCACPLASCILIPVGILQVFGCTRTIIGIYV